MFAGNSADSSDCDLIQFLRHILRVSHSQRQFIPDQDHSHTTSSNLGPQHLMESPPLSGQLINVDESCPTTQLHQPRVHEVPS